MTWLIHISESFVGSNQLFFFSSQNFCNCSCIYPLDCSGKFDKGSVLSLPVTQFPTTCHALFVAKANQTVYVSSGNRTSQSVLLYDGGSINAPQIGDFRIGNLPDH